MRALSVRELNKNISKALSRVEAGETLDIMRNGKVIAELRPKRAIRDAKWRKAYLDSASVLKDGFAIGAGKITEDDKYGDAAL
jgi:antitoxin (DNA-binding transcriptional repressor) of toxin-antitoxin stability system